MYPSDDEVRDAFQEALEKIEQRQEDYWNSLSKDQQIDVFCAVIRRLHEGELQDRRSYRGVLYDVFGFGPEAYLPAQMAGYLDIHNALFDTCQDKQEPV